METDDGKKEEVKVEKELTVIQGLTPDCMATIIRYERVKFITRSLQRCIMFVCVGILYVPCFLMTSFCFA